MQMEFWITRAYMRSDQISLNIFKMFNYNSRVASGDQNEK